MKKYFQHIILLLIVLNPIYLSAQKPEAQDKLEAIVESIVENLEEDAEVTQITQDLEQLAENPLNINTATESELSKLHILNSIQINKIIEYRNEFGPVLSIYELNTVDGISPDVLLKMEPFISFGPSQEKPETLSEAMKYGTHLLLIRTQEVLQQQKGYIARDDGTIPYEGSRGKLYTRYRYESGDRISAGITAEKDPGEAFFNGSNRNGFDFYSAHISLQVSPFIQKIVVGDFVARSGQGLVLWQGYSTSKSLYTLGISKVNQGIRPFTSTDENLFFRGAAATLKVGNGTVELFYSNKKDDANLAVSDSAGNYFTSLQTSGYHRTESETADKNSVTDINSGAILSWSFNNFKLGATIAYQQFEMPFIRSSQLYNKFRFQGEQNFTAGADYLYSKGKYQLFGEAAVSKSTGKAFLQGAVAHLHDRLDFSLLFRHFDKNYNALWANPFSEGSSANNETGLYFGTKILPFKYVTLSAYSDFYHSEWITFTTAGPATGHDIFAQADFVFSERFQFYIRYKNEEKEQKTNFEGRLVNENEKVQKSRLHFEFRPREYLALKTRIEHVFFEGQERETGIMLYQDVKITPAKFPLSASFRTTWFNTDSYNSRIYAYESDVLYAFSIPAYFGKGWHNYINIRYELSRKLDVWFKIGHTIRSDSETISSGYNVIDGNRKTEVKFQVRLKI